MHSYSRTWTCHNRVQGKPHVSNTCVPQERVPMYLHTLHMYEVMREVAQPLAPKLQIISA